MCDARHIKGQQKFLVSLGVPLHIAEFSEIGGFWWKIIEDKIKEKFMQQERKRLNEQFKNF